MGSHTRGLDEIIKGLNSPKLRRLASWPHHILCQPQEEREANLNLVVSRPQRRGSSITEDKDAELLWSVETTACSLQPAQNGLGLKIIQGGQAGNTHNSVSSFAILHNEGSLRQLGPRA